MSLIVTEVYEAFIDAGASEEKAKAAASAIPVSEQLATKNDITEVKTHITEVEVRMANEFKALYRNLWVVAVSIISLTVALVKVIP